MFEQGQMEDSSLKQLVYVLREKQAAVLGVMGGAGRARE